MYIVDALGLSNSGMAETCRCVCSSGSGDEKVVSTITGLCWCQCGCSGAGDEVNDSSNYAISEETCEG